MDIQTNYLQVQKTARYSTYGEISAKTKYFWMVLHGSHMQCEQVLYKFKDFNPAEHFIVAPEGLSRFYEKGFGGNVVSTWMTSRDRKYEIVDFSNYLSQLFQKYQEKLPVSCKIIVMGFSQGGTSLFRWLHAENITVDYFLAYSCWIPEDINLGMGLVSNINNPIIYTYGEQDEFLTEERIDQIKQIISSNKLPVVIEKYKGKHKIEKDQLIKLYEQYISK